MLAVTVLSLAFPILFEAWVDRFTGFPLQGREILPALMFIPLTAGEVISRHMSSRTEARSARLALGGLLALVAAFQAYAWWYDARFVAGAPGTIRFYAHAIWRPPMGWLPWVGLAGLGILLLLVFASTEGFGGPRAARSP